MPTLLFFINPLFSSFPRNEAAGAYLDRYARVPALFPRDSALFSSPYV